MTVLLFSVKSIARKPFGSSSRRVFKMSRIRIVIRIVIRSQSRQTLEESQADMVGRSTSRFFRIWL